MFSRSSTHHSDQQHVNDSLDDEGAWEVVYDDPATDRGRDNSQEGRVRGSAYLDAIMAECRITEVRLTSVAPPPASCSRPGVPAMCSPWQAAQPRACLQLQDQPTSQR
jgi:hypothetical protein